MIVKDIVTTFSDYKETGLLVAFPKCSFKCCKEYCDGDTSICQNSELALSDSFEIDNESILKYFTDDIHRALIFGGLEPLDSYYDMMMLIASFREKYDYPVVIYTGYTENEVEKIGAITWFKEYGNIVVKYGRFVPECDSHFDDILGVELASDNQYAVQY